MRTAVIRGGHPVKLGGPWFAGGCAMQRAQLRLPASVAVRIAGLGFTAYRAPPRLLLLHPLTLWTAQVRYGGSDADNDSAFQRCHASRYSCAGGQRPQPVNRFFDEHLPAVVTALLTGSSTSSLQEKVPRARAMILPYVPVRC